MEVPTPEELLALFAGLQDTVWNYEEFFKTEFFNTIPETELERARTRTTPELLEELRDIYDPLRNAQETVLLERGEEVLPFALEELPNAEGYYRLFLLRILSTIPSEARDEVFIRVIRRWRTETIVRQ